MEEYYKDKESEDVGWNQLAKDEVQWRFSFSKGRYELRVFHNRKEFSPLHSVQTGSGAHPASYPMGTGGFSSGVKRRRTTHLQLVPGSRKLRSTHLLPLTPSLRSA
jgi:hypothetical protein